MQVAYTQLSKKGLITIPVILRRALGLLEKEQPLLKLTELNGRVVVEPVRTIDVADIRVYTDEEVDRFLTEDKLTKKERIDAENYLKNLP